MSNALSSMSLNESPAPHALLNATYHLIATNDAWDHLCRRHPLSGESWFDQISEKNLAEELPLIARLQAGELAAYTCFSRLRCDTGDQPVQLSVIRLADGQVVVSAIAIMVAEPTVSPGTPSSAERTAAEDQALAAAISHDFRQHLRLVTSYLSLIERQGGERLDERVRGHLKIAADHATRLQGLILDLVRWLRLASDPVARSPCAIERAWNAALESEAALIERTGAIIRQESELPEVIADPTLLTQILVQLLRNALLYHGSGAPTVKLRVDTIAHGWRIVVSDDGPGIAETDLPRARGLFQRLHAWEQIPGNGMGLPLAERMVSRLGGTMNVALTGPDGGCTVIVLLPR